MLNKTKKQDFSDFQYVPGHFAEYFNTEDGQRVYLFVTVPQNVDRLVTAAELLCVSVEGIQKPLLQEFDDSVMTNRAKQAIGHLTRQIMEFYGYRIERNNVQLRRQLLFKTGARYVEVPMEEEVELTPVPELQKSHHSGLSETTAETPNSSLNLAP